MLNIRNLRFDIFMEYHLEYRVRLFTLVRDCALVIATLP